MQISFDTLKEMLPGARTYANYVSGLCPFHEDRKPSLLLFEDGWFRCLGCGVQGGYEKLYRKLKGWDYSKTVSVEEQFTPPPLPRDLTEQEEIVESAHNSLIKFEQFRWYLEKRGVDGRIEPCRLGWYRGWYTVPFYSPDDEYIGMVMRSGPAIQALTNIRFVQPKGQRPILYCPEWRLINKSPALAVVFGIFDALAISELRFPVVTPIMGKGSLDIRWLDFVRKPIYIIPDKGEEVTAKQYANKLGWRGRVINLPYPEDIKDPAGYLETGRSSQLLSAIGGYLS